VVIEYAVHRGFLGMGGFETSIAKEEFWSAVGYWILVAGLVGDIIVIAIPAHKARLEKALAVFFTIVIIVGVAIEHRADAAISVFVSQEGAFTALKMKEADERAASAQQAAASANALAAQARIEEEKLRLQNLELQEKLAPRHLTREQQQRITRKLRTFPGQRVAIFSCSGDLEIKSFTDDFVHLFTPETSGWILAAFASGVEPHGRTIAGVLVEVGKGADSRSVSAAQVLVGALMNERIVASGPSERNDEGMLLMGQNGSVDTSTPITITIGKKP
jgi:hypothetical protein